MKVAMMAFIPVLLTSIIITGFTYTQIKKIGETEIQNFEEQMMASKKLELKNYVDTAYSSIESVYNDTSLSTEEAQKRAAEIMMSLYYGTDGYFFMTDYEGVITAHRVSPDLIGKNLYNFKDKQGTQLFKELIDAARDKTGYVTYVWYKESKDTEVEKLSYAVALDKWQWIIGTGFYIDDIQDAVAEKQADLSTTIKKTVSIILIVSALILIGIIIVSIFLTNILTKSIVLANEFLKEISEGEGDLTKELPVTSKDEVGMLATHFNTFIGKLNEIISIVKNGSANVAAASTELASATEELSVTIQDQATQVNSVASATEEISVTSSEVMNSIGEANTETANAESLTVTGREKLVSSVNEVMGIKDKVETLGVTIGNLATSSEEIGNIINVINDIADQTNLLALNAAIEAARAGEHGRGFAVVADEVRKLAERTQGATKEIENIIVSLQQETGNATKDMQEATTKVMDGAEAIKDTESVFEQIVASVEGINRTNGMINGSIEEQVSAITNINDNAQVISAGIEQSSTALHQVSRTVSDLQQQADELHLLVEKFKTK
jgi:methyl-accepting chemotaxis protein